MTKNWNCVINISMSEILFGNRCIWSCLWSIHHKNDMVFKYGHEINSIQHQAWVRTNIFVWWMRTSNEALILHLICVHVPNRRKQFCSSNGNHVISTWNINRVISTRNGNHVISTGNINHVISTGNMNHVISTGNINHLITTWNINAHDMNLKPLPCVTTWYQPET